MGEFAPRMNNRLTRRAGTALAGGLLLLSACAHPRPGETIETGASVAPSVSAEAVPSVDPSPVDGVYAEKVTDPAGAAVVHDAYGAGGTVATIPAGSDIGVSCWTKSGSTGKAVLEIGRGPHIGEFVDPDAVGLGDNYADVLPPCEDAVRGD